jgi:histidinol dehydrogenase
MNDRDKQLSGPFAGPESHPRGRQEAAIVYPVISRRARGLSLGINLFPDRKQCTYHCPYCEVQPFSNPDVSIRSGMVEAALRAFFAHEWRRYSTQFELKDISVSGNGEPTLSPFLEEALEAAYRVLQDLVGANPYFARVPVVLITNSTGFLRPKLCEMLEHFSQKAHFEVWAKLDGGSQAMHRILSGSEFDYGSIVDAIADVAFHVPVKLQTMVCRDDRSGQTLFDPDGYLATLRALAQKGAQISAVQLYTVARPPAEPWIAGLDDAELRLIAGRVRTALPEGIEVECFGRTGYIG